MTWNSSKTRSYEANRSGCRGGEHSDRSVPWTVRQWLADKHRVATVEQCDEHLEAMRHEAQAIERRMIPECFAGRGRLRLIAAELEAARSARSVIAAGGGTA